MDNSKKFAESARVCWENGNRLVEEAELLSLSQSSTCVAISILAQEEFAKAFLLLLVARGIIPWNQFVLRATREHNSKHLLCIIIDHIETEVEDLRANFSRRMAKYDEFEAEHDEYMAILHSLSETSNAAERAVLWKKIHKMDEIREARKALEILPSDVADAINIFRHEKIGRWETSDRARDLRRLAQKRVAVSSGGKSLDGSQTSWFWVEEPDYDPRARGAFEGRRDREKQDALYVRIKKDGSFANKPASLDQKTVEVEVERARKGSSAVSRMLSVDYEGGVELNKVAEIMKTVFFDAHMVAVGRRPEPCKTS
jgi:AbiV family abortive infection protein